MDPNLLSLLQAVVPPGGRFMAMASGVVSGGTTWPNQIVNLVQGLSVVPQHLEQSKLLVSALVMALGKFAKRNHRRHKDPR